MKKLLTIGAVAMFATPAFAANNIFSCTAENGSPVSVTKIGSDYEFTYGQVSFKNPVKQVFANQDSYVATGSGFITSSLEMRNNGTSYTIQFVQPHNSNSIEEPMLYITNGSKMDTVSCKAGSATQNFERRSMKAS